MDKIVAQVQAEGPGLSDNERWMLRFSESDPDFVIDPVRVEQLEAEISDEEYEAKIVGLLQRAYQRDVEAGSAAQAMYREASTSLHQGDHYLLIMIDHALGPAVEGTTGTKLVRVLAQSGLFVLLVVPGSFAILMACGIAGVALTQGVESPGELAGPVLGSVVLGGIGYYLIHLWRTERKKRRIAA